MVGVYGWIREGVRRAVLLGFSDAIEQIGVPHEGEEINEKFAAVLRPAPSTAATSLPSGNTKSGRKRLGRSLNQITSDSKSR